MSNPTHLHQHSLIQQSQSRYRIFYSENPVYNFKIKPNSFKQNQYHTNQRHNPSTIHKKRIYTNKKETFISLQTRLIPAKKLLKSLHSPTAVKRHRSAFSKTQVHLNSNALAFSSKRKRVFPKALQGFLPNTSAFSPEISLFTQIFSCLIT